MTIVNAFDDTSEEVIQVRHVVTPIDDFPETVVVTYSRLKFDYLLQHYPFDHIATLNTACAPIRIYRVEVDGVRYAAYPSLIGGPAAVGIMEEVIGFGGSRFLFFGSCRPRVQDRESAGVEGTLYAFGSSCASRS